MKKRTKAVLFVLPIILAFLMLSPSAYAKDFSSAKEISLDSRVSGTLSHTATYDYYSFTTESGNNIYKCSWESGSGSNKGELFSVYNSRGSQMGSTASVYTSQTQYLKLDANETYYVEVRANNPLRELNGEYGVIQDYSFVISAIPDEANSISEANTIELNSEQRGNINNCHKLDKDYFKIKTDSAKEYEFYGKNVDFAGKIYFRLLDNDGAEVEEIGCSRGYPKNEEVKLNPNSTYYFYVYGTHVGSGLASDYNIIGDYIFALKKSSSEQESTEESSSNQGISASPNVIEGKNLEWNEVGGKSYWYENGIKQGTYDDPQGVMGDGTVRGREIYDSASNAWYWLDSVYDGAKACGKEVWMPYIYQNEANWDENEINNNAASSSAYAEGNYEHAELADQVKAAINSRTGKWVRYDNNGRMMKGWVTIEGELAVLYPDQVGNTYYYDRKTGLMAKGYTKIDGKTYYFDEISGVLK